MAYGRVPARRALAQTRSHLLVSQRRPALGPVWVWVRALDRFERGRQPPLTVTTCLSQR